MHKPGLAGYLEIASRFPVNPNHQANSAFEERGDRVKLYLHDYFERLGRVDLEDVSPSDVRLAMANIDWESIDAELMMYVGQLIIAVITDADIPEFSGMNVTCVCGGRYSLDREAWNYKCSSCTREGKADKHGIPQSLPVEKDLGKYRHLLHERIRKLRSYNFIPDHLGVNSIYRMVSIYSRIPLGYCHIGWLTTAEQFASFYFAIDKLEVETAKAYLAAKGEEN